MRSMVRKTRLGVVYAGEIVQWGWGMSCRSMGWEIQLGRTQYRGVSGGIFQT